MAGQDRQQPQLPFENDPSNERAESQSPNILKKKSSKKKNAANEPAKDELPAAANGDNGGDGGAHEIPEADHHFHDGEPLRRRIDDSFLQYASYVIRDRAIPRIEDGLKPVQRRILYSLHRNDDGKFIKVANIAGYCMQFHPHGDVSITDALVVLANKRYLIEGQGNFGNLFTGDRAAASRYIECRLTDLAREEIFNDELTEFVPTYDGRNKEPVTLPAKIPLLLMLGAEGIAVGMASRILPHNFIELLQAQIAILKKKPFEILPDFQQGCLMDAGDYKDGNGSVRLRSRVKVKSDTTLTINEVPFTVTTESLIASIEDAAKKGKIKVRSINDFTSERIEIEVKLSPGADAQTAIRALYAFTDCEVSISSRITVIKEDRPCEMTVSEILRFNTEKLLKDLEAELALKKEKLLAELHFKTLVQIFVENRLYKKIENCKTAESVTRAIYKAFEPFKDQLIREINDRDVEMLLGVHIRRISLFDINKHREDMERIQKELAEVEKNLKALTPYAVKRLEALIKKYKDLYPRLTEITSFEAVEAKAVAARSLTLGYDREKGYLGHQVSGKEFNFKCSPFDKLILVWDDGSYKMIPIPDKVYVGKNLVHCGHYERDRVMTVAYRHRDGAYLKRFTFGGSIQFKEYRLAPPKSKILFFEPDTPECLYLKYTPKPGQRIHQQIAEPGGLAVKSAKAKGNQMTGKKIAKISSTRPRGWKDEENGPKLAFGS